MIQKIIFIFSVFISISAFSFACDHFEHYRNLQIAAQVYEIKNVINSNKDSISPEDFDKIDFHLKTIESIIYHCPKEVNDLDIH